MYTCFVFYIRTWKDHVLVFPAFGDWLLADLEEQRHMKWFWNFTKESMHVESCILNMLILLSVYEFYQTSLWA